MERTRYLPSPTVPTTTDNIPPYGNDLDNGTRSLVSMVIVLRLQRSIGAGFSHDLQGLEDIEFHKGSSSCIDDGKALAHHRWKFLLGFMRLAAFLRRCPTFRLHFWTRPCTPDFVLGYRSMRALRLSLVELIEYRLDMAGRSWNEYRTV